jgi:hypothetical protein
VRLAFVTEDTALQLTIELVAVADPIHGSVTDQAGASHQFSGWTGLLAELDSAIDAVKTGPGPAGADGGHKGRHGGPGRRGGPPSGGSVATTANFGGITMKFFKRGWSIVGRTKKRKVVSAAVFALLVAGASVGIAAWSAQTSGQGEAVATTANAVTLSPNSNGTPTLYPGGPAATIYFTASNPNPYAVTLTTASYSNPVSFNSTSCPSANISVASGAPSTVSLSLPANASNVAVSIPGVLQLAHSAPDGCQGASFGVAVSMSGAQQ